MRDFSLFRYSDKELKELLSSMIFLIDSREQQNGHILQYFDRKKLPYKVLKLDVGDYSAVLPKNPEMGIQRDLYIPATIERKNSIDELVSNFKGDRRTAFQNELIRSQGTDFVLLVEQQDGYESILANKYRSEMKPQSVIGTLKSFESRYRFNTIFVDRAVCPSWIYHHLYYRTRAMLKG